MARWEPEAQTRLMGAAITLFAERGYDETTVAEIAEAAGLTKRTFFRYFGDKREVLFMGSEQLQELWISGIHGAPVEAGPMAAVDAGLDAVAELFADRHPFAVMRAGIVASHPELQERELIKLQTLTGAIATALVGRGSCEAAATLAAHSGVTVFHVAFGLWVAQEDPGAFRGLMTQTLTALRSVIAEP